MSNAVREIGAVRTAGLSFCRHFGTLPLEETKGCKLLGDLFWLNN